MTARGGGVPALRIRFSRDDRNEIRNRIDACLERGRIAQGENVEEFEEVVRNLTGRRHAVAVTSGGAALEVAMQLLGVKGNTVVVPTNTFVATAVAVTLAGGTVSLADADPSTFSISVSTIKQARTADTVGVIVVHVGGIVSPELGAIRDYCRAEGLWLFEDCAHAHGSEHGGIKAGQFGVGGALSFFATKVVTSAEGGMLVTDNDEFADRARRYRDYGKSEQWLSTSAELGANRRMSEICAAIGVVHTRRLDQVIEARRKVAEEYTARLNNLPVSTVVSRDRTSWYKYIVLLPSGLSRDAVRQRMSSDGVGLAGGVYDVPLHQQGLFPSSNRQFPSADDICARHICLPIYPGLEEDEVELVVESLRRAIAGKPDVPGGAAAARPQTR